ncbi:MAG: efflux RND transporter periplasmic adaptor subunit [Saprospiraceae bacterium]
MTKYKPLNLIVILSLLLVYCKQKATLSPTEEVEQLKANILASNKRIKELEIIIQQSDTSSLSKIKKAKKVIVDTIKLQDFQHYVEAQGMVDAELNVLAAPQMPGVILRINVKEGDYVRIGQILASMDANSIRQGIEEVKTGLALATTMYEKQKSLWEQNIGSEAQYLMSKNQKEQLEKKIVTLNSQLSMSTIKSPVNGTIDEIKVKIGEMASPGINGIRVVNNSKLKIKAKLSDMYSHLVKKGNTVLIYFPDTEKEIESTLSFVSQAVNMSSRTILVEANLPSSPEFKSNQTAKIKINDSKLKNVIVINSNLIQKSINGEDYVLVSELQDGIYRAKKKVIEVSTEYNGYSVIKSGLKKGETIISMGYIELVDGQIIQI